ncbi:hypothetical protein, partial [Pseudomonas coronafaciens]|uniref:hypothetical protein n=1 Tax=Pseudomonas coronafaciens TaxID=53409 RepID=UPI001C0FBA16
AKQGRQVEKNRLGNEDGANGLIFQRLLRVAAVVISLCSDKVSFRCLVCLRARVCYAARARAERLDLRCVEHFAAVFAGVEFHFGFSNG